MRIEIAYASAQRQTVKGYCLEAPACVADALLLAKSDLDFAGLELEHCAVGIFGQVVGREHPLADGDRVEVYRPLAADPKDARRARAKAGFAPNTSGRS